MIITAWTDTQVDSLRALWSTHSARDIAAKIGATRDAVLGKARRLNLPSKKITDWRRIGIKRLAAPVVNVEPLDICFAALSKHKCRWITNEDSRAPLYCAHDVVAGTAWCPSHYVIVYRPAPASTRVEA